MEGKQVNFARMDMYRDIFGSMRPDEPIKPARVYMMLFGFVRTAEALLEKVTEKARNKKWAKEVVGGRFYPLRADICVKVEGGKFEAY